jgi:outer membrane protein assembly factor BamB
MRPRTVAALLVVVVALAGVGAFALLGSGPGLTERWVSDTESDVRGNHHAVAAARIDGEGLVFAPIGGRSGEEGCALVALDAAGEEVWRDPVPPEDCTIHAVADPTVADWTGDPTPEVLSSTTEERVSAHDALTGEETFAAPLEDYGYTKPVVDDVTGDGERELVVLDVTGTVFVYRADGGLVWSRTFGAYTWAQPVVTDFDADGDREVVAGFDDGSLRLLDGATGDAVWSASTDGPVTWLTISEDDRDVTVFAATADGDVLAIDGATGDREWTRPLGRFAAVRAVGDPDGDGERAVYATARDGVLRALSAATGEVEWETTLTAGDVQMTPPPSMGDLDGDGDPELVAATNDGLVRVVDPVDGSILATYERESTLYTHVTLADLDDNGRAEVYVPYGDGRVVALWFG